MSTNFFSESKSLYLLFAAIPAVALPLAAQEVETATTPRHAEASMPKTSQDTPSDERISEAIEDELLLDRAVPSHRIDVVTQDGVVTLSGRTDNLLASERAATIARTVRGVRAVIDRIDVTPPDDLSAAEIERSVERALLTDPATDSYEVDVSVATGGVVTLSGTVQSWAERSLAEHVAAGVTGVTKVVNTITVDYRTNRTDAEIVNDVQQRLRWHVLIDDGLIDVTCKDGKLELSGTVGSAAERSRARTCSWVAGVRDVDAEGLEVARWARDEMLRGSKYAVRSDEQIREAVQAALRHDPRVSRFDVIVAVDRGEVTLRGEVDNLKARRAAAQDARNTVGVTMVQNRLKVEPENPLSSVIVAKDVEAALRRDPYVDADDVSVTVHNGTARLFGRVDTNYQRACADDAASRVPGVVEVENLIAVRDGAHSPFDPWVDTTPLYAYGWYRYEPWRTFDSDDEIERRIEEELWWSPYVDSGDVTVAVVGGIANLSGEVHSASERLAATENAYEGGAVWVNNDLEIVGQEKADGSGSQ